MQTLQQQSVFYSFNLIRFHNAEKAVHTNLV